MIEDIPPVGIELRYFANDGLLINFVFNGLKVTIRVNDRGVK